MLPESTQKEDIHLNSSPPPHTAQVSQKEHDVCQDLPKHKALENEDICQVLENPPRLLKDEVAVSTEVPPRRARGRTGEDKVGQWSLTHYLL